MARAQINPDEIPAKLSQLERALTRVQETKDRAGLGVMEDGQQTRLIREVNATMDAVFGEQTTEAGHEFRVSGLWFNPMPRESLNRAQQVAIDRIIDTIKAASQRLSDKLADAEVIDPNKTLRAYQGMDLHPVIAAAASGLYADGHFKNAVLDAVIALNNHVRAKSFVTDLDGVGLMEYVFGPKNPVLQFNALETTSDRDEQKGYMGMFSGAVSGLRNPRAHGLVVDDPERALEFIAFVSLLTKLVDGAKLNRSDSST